MCVFVIYMCVVKQNWEKEIKYWLGKERLNPLTLGDSKSKSMCTQTLKDFSLDKHPVLIISYEQLRNNISAINPSVCGLIVSTITTTTKITKQTIRL